MESQFQDKSEFKKRFNLGEEELGNGMYGQVILGYDIERNNQQVAIKEIKIRGESQFQQIKEELVENLLLKQNQSDFIVQILGVYYWFKNNRKEHIFMVVMELAHSNLEKFMKSKEAQQYLTSEENLLEILGQLAQGCQNLKDLEIANFRVNPRNILVFEDENQSQAQQSQQRELVNKKSYHFKLGDISLGRNYQSDWKIEKNLLQFALSGNCHYLSPEMFQQFNKIKEDQNASINFNFDQEKSDIWTIGIILLEIYYKQHQIIQFLNSLGDLESVSKLIDKISFPVVKEVLEKILLRKKPNFRPSFFEIKQYSNVANDTSFRRKSFSYRSSLSVTQEKFFDQQNQDVKKQKDQDKIVYQNEEVVTSQNQIQNQVQKSPIVIQIPQGNSNKDQNSDRKQNQQQKIYHEDDFNQKSSVNNEKINIPPQFEQIQIQHNINSVTPKVENSKFFSKNETYENESINDTSKVNQHDSDNENQKGNNQQNETQNSINSNQQAQNIIQKLVKSQSNNFKKEMKNQESFKSLQQENQNSPLNKQTNPSYQNNLNSPTNKKNNLEINTSRSVEKSQFNNQSNQNSNNVSPQNIIAFNQSIQKDEENDEQNQEQEYNQSQQDSNTQKQIENEKQKELQLQTQFQATQKIEQREILDISNQTNVSEHQGEHLAQNSKNLERFLVFTLVDPKANFRTIIGEKGTIGKQFNKNQIVFNDEDSCDLSTIHASFYYNKEKDSYFIQDEKSSSGTYIRLLPEEKNILEIKKGQQVKLEGFFEQEAKEGLLIQIGEELVTVKSVKNINQDGSIILIDLEYSQILKDPTKPINIQIQLKPNQKEFIGRQAWAQYKPSGEMSSQHLYFYIDNYSLKHTPSQTKVLIKDNNSTNGTWIRVSEKRKRSEPIQLPNTCFIRLGFNHKFIVQKMTLEDLKQNQKLMDSKQTDCPENMKNQFSYLIADCFHRIDEATKIKFKQLQIEKHFACPQCSRNSKACLQQWIV